MNMAPKQVAPTARRYRKQNRRPRPVDTSCRRPSQRRILFCSYPGAAQLRTQASTKPSAICQPPFGMSYHHHIEHSLFTTYVDGTRVGGCSRPIFCHSQSYANLTFKSAPLLLSRWDFWQLLQGAAHKLENRCTRGRRPWCATRPDEATIGKQAQGSVYSAPRCTRLFRQDNPSSSCKNHCIAPVASIPTTTLPPDLLKQRKTLAPGSLRGPASSR
jgi:hypothetical protein